MSESKFSSEACYVCNYSEDMHGEHGGHKFWSNASAKEEFSKESLNDRVGVESRYVSEYRPY